MVATISAIRSSGQAASYFESDDYYSEGGVSPSEWQGEGAKALDLKGEVDRDRFKELLEGKLPDGTTLGTNKSDVLEHRPGWDLTLSAPKSVSVMALVAGDERLVEAHAKAASVTMAFIEEFAAETRVRGKDGVEHVQTGNLVIGSFLHQTSREEDPQLHTHNVILNMTQDEDGNWRSLESRPLYQIQKAAGEIYRQELAHRVAQLGYEIDVGKDSNFEIKGLSRDLLLAFSERSSQIEKHLEARGKDRASASAEEKQIAALDTREAKGEIDRTGLVQGWRDKADELGFDQAKRQDLVHAAEQLAEDDRRSLLIKGEAEALAHTAVAFAHNKLGERQAVFSSVDLQKEAGRFGMGRVDNAVIRGAMAQAVERGELVPRAYINRQGREGQGYTTRASLDYEQRLLSAEMRGRHGAEAVAAPIKAAEIVATAARNSEDQGFGWTDDQRQATKGLLASTHAVTAIQGYAGTAKTTTVLATFADAAQAAGFEIKAMAPSASAAQTLGDALTLPAVTVERHLRLLERQAEPKTNDRQIWLIDEASLISARDMTRLLEAAEQRGARTVLVGDYKQLNSVGAGAAFRQLQEAGMPTFKLEKVVRQTNELTLEAVEHSIKGKAKQALDALDRGGGRVMEHATASDRMGAIADTYAALSEDERRKTIVIDPSREGRDLLTDQIRNALADKGELGDQAITMRTLNQKDMTRAEIRAAKAYEPGDVVIFNKADRAYGIERGAAFDVARVDTHKGTVALRDKHGQERNWQPDTWGSVEVFQGQNRELRAGDRIEFTRNNAAQARINGLKAEVTKVNPDRETITIKTERGKTVTLSIHEASDQHIRHAYVQTAYASQGQTAERAFIHFESNRTNLVDQSVLYVSISRAKAEAVIYTDDRDKLIQGIHERSGQAQSALKQSADHTIKQSWSI
ncbi:MobF family relaxase [Asticcacaulis sp. W401b]|uniref:MobF family relaxase n=1 Tax=Asticcacaulis sp. W401b TaxID=3388666 RepID=UPI00397053A5